LSGASAAKLGEAPRSTQEATEQTSRIFNTQTPGA
jgi:hypothetical protein